MPYGEDLYTVEFCGPGGGGCTREPRGQFATPIHGDPDYEVLSEDKIRIWYADTYAPVYIKCTTETHPRLAYSAADEAEARWGLAMAVLVHLAYAGFGVMVYLALGKHLPSWNEKRGLFIRSGLLALVFAPGPIWSFPFVALSFALLALIAQLEAALSSGYWMFVGVQFLLSTASILIAWVVLLLGCMLVRILGRQGRAT